MISTRLTLIRGLPGSGKSTLAKQLASTNTDIVHLETDQYWGEDYRFDASKLSEAHEWCQHQAEHELRLGKTVIVSNTFTRLWELEPYFGIAFTYDVVPQVIECHGAWKSVHSVPDSVIDKMRDRWESNVSQLWDKYLKRDVK